ncbi:4-hydroxythreonine-4-phosphate dehydrogenase [Candidatus Nitromaritima sp. SCGC AAA799-C22]|nr:4-hydroxythreonine-4-phosphate dehydrogenase [Candidatus Nitromaritima sp. SCGC AAA799-C22]
MEDRPRIAVTMGDPAGVGPEIIVKSFQDDSIHGFSRPLAVGDATCLRETALQFAPCLTVRPIASPQEAAFAPGTLDVIDLNNVPAGLATGQPGPEGGRAAVEYIRAAVDLAMDQRVDAIATAPINKESIHRAGFNHPGHTELLAEYTGAENVALMLAGDALRVVLVTTHVPLDAVKKLITRERVTATLRLAHRWLMEHVTDSPRIAVTGLNPHCGDGGIFGEEEQSTILPALETARREGIEAAGPFSADALFTRLKPNEYDAVVTMYHDQGMIPVKMANRGKSVNVTLGLPIIRTSVDHGTAFDIAGKGSACADSLKTALRTAAQLAKPTAVRP